MSVVRTISIEDVNGNNHNNVADLKIGNAKAWVRFTVAGTIQESFNVSSITKNATGNWTVFFENPMPTNTYAATVGAMSTFNTHGGYGVSSYATNSLLVVNISAGLGSDAGVQVALAVFGE